MNCIGIDTVLTDRNLSLRAKGLYIYLKAKPDNWNGSVERIASENREGTQAVRRAIQELERAGYLKRKLFRGQCGRIDGYRYILT